MSIIRNRMVAAAVAVVALLPASAQQKANYNTIPLPRSIELKDKGELVVRGSALERSIQMHIDTKASRWAADKVKDDAYEISVSKKGIEICAPTEKGLFYGRQTLRKALHLQDDNDTTTYVLPYVEIHDSPEFGYRGVHLDCARHFFPVSFIKKYIDLIALHGGNVLHWHITDDQGWRFEVKRYPLLTGVGSWRANTVVGHNLGIYDDTPYGGFYTQDECREIVRYAAERHITVMPEIDLPGHMVAALAAYPQYGCTGGPYETWNMWGISDEVLCPGNPETLKFICGVLEELIDVFPSKMIHLGGDECPKVRWEKCPKCQAKIKELGIKEHYGQTPENQLQNWFMHQAELFLNERGRSMIGWDEILEGGISATASVMSWRGQEGGVAAARSGHDVVMVPTSNCYLNFYQSKNRVAEPTSFDAYLPLSQVYALKPIPDELTEEEANHILGCQANLWTEYICSPQQAEFTLLPRLAAISEAQWMSQSKRSYYEFLIRLPWLVDYYTQLGYKCSDKRE